VRGRRISTTGIAAAIDLEGGGAEGGTPGQWSQTVNPWSSDPDAIEILFNPLVTSAWYAETDGNWGAGEACIGVEGGRQFPTPTFYSVPGNDARDVPPWETAESAPYTPGMAVGIPAGTKTGPYLEAWAEGTEATLQTASLVGPSGPVVVRVVGPDTPAPPPSEGVVDGIASLVIPVSALGPSSAYTLTATWSDSTGAYTQTAQFTTESAHAANTPFECETCPHGAFRFVTARGKVTASLSPAADQTVTITVGHARKVCGVRRIHCPAGDARYLFDTHMTRVFRHYRSPVTFSLPRPTLGFSVVAVTATASRFSGACAVSVGEVNAW